MWSSGEAAALVREFARPVDRGTEHECVCRFGARQVTESRLSPGALSTFVIYALYVGTNTGAVANIISQLIQVRPNNGAAEGTRDLPKPSRVRCRAGSGGE